jgi:hypothetical protein
MKLSFRLRKRLTRKIRYRPESVLSKRYAMNTLGKEISLSFAYAAVNLWAMTLRLDTFRSLATTQALDTTKIIFTDSGSIAIDIKGATLEAMRSGYAKRLVTLEWIDCMRLSIQ